MKGESATSAGCKENSFQDQIFCAVQSFCRVLNRGRLILSVLGLNLEGLGFEGVGLQAEKFFHVNMAFSTFACFPKRTLPHALKLPLRVQVPNNHILTQNLYYNYYYPNPKYLIIGYMDPLGSVLIPNPKSENPNCQTLRTKCQSQSQSVDLRPYIARVTIDLPSDMLVLGLGFPLRLKLFPPSAECSRYVMAYHRENICY